MIRLLYWTLVALDIAGMLFLFVLGLAAAVSARTHPLMVALVMLALPGIPLWLSIWVFLRSTSPWWRAMAFVLVAAPLVIAVSTKAYNDAVFSAHSDEQGNLTFFKRGAQRDLIEAIQRNDDSAVKMLTPRVDVNAAGMQAMTPLVMALRQLRATPDRHEVLKALLAAGADPNQGTAYELPLEMALQIDDRTGPAPVALLLARGANPNVRNGSGVPIWFGAAGAGSAVETVELMLKHGADIRASGAKGETVLFYAAGASNWHAALYLLEHGADWRQGRSFKGQTYVEMIETLVRERRARDDYAGRKPADDGLQEVMSFLKRR